MKLAKTTALLTLSVLGMTATLPALADRGHGGWGFGIGIITGAVIGSQMVRPYYPYYYPSYSPTVIVQQPVVVAPPTSAPGTWYYCEPARAYYPYVSTCPEPWRAVPAVPPGR